MATTIKVLKGSTKGFENTARELVAGGRDLYNWLFESAPVGFVTFETEHTRGEEYVKGLVRTERVWNPLLRRVEVIRRVSVDLMPG